MPPAASVVVGIDVAKAEIVMASHPSGERWIDAVLGMVGAERNRLAGQRESSALGPGRLSHCAANA
jgi:hypothetical protein